MRLTGSGSGSGVGANENSPFPEAGPQGRSFIQSPGTRPAPRAPPRPWVQGVSPIFPHHLEVGPQGRPFMYRPGRQPGDQQWCWAPVPGFAPWDWHGRASLRSGLCRLGVPGSHGSRRGLWMDGPSTDEGLGTGSGAGAGANVIRPYTGVAGGVGTDPVWLIADAADRVRVRVRRRGE